MSDHSIFEIRQHNYTQPRAPIGEADSDALFLMKPPGRRLGNSIEKSDSAKSGLSVFSLGRKGLCLSNLKLPHFR